MEETDPAFVPTKASSIKKISNFAVVEYKSHKPKISSQKNVHNKTDANQDNMDSFNVKKAKQEVIKFSMNGLESSKKTEAKMQLAIKLGAKPPKNKYKNYKELIEEKRKENNKEKSRILLQQLGKNSIGKSTAKGKSFDRKRRKNKGDLLDVYGKVKFNTSNKKR